jgi:choline dehydrogenase
MMIVAMNRLGDGLGRNTRAPTANFGLLGVWVNRCFSRGALRLASPDPLMQPIIEENMLDDARDVLRMRDGVQRLLRIAQQPGFASIAQLITTGVDGDSLDTLDSDAAIDRWVMHTAGDAQHATSTCRMGEASSPASVVDASCRVLGTAGLRVIDASIMPSVVCANTHLTTVMIAETMAHRLESH